MHMNVFLFTILCLLFVITDVTGNAQPFNSMHYSLDMQNVNTFLHRSALMALMKVKANSIISIPNFPNLEKLIYKQCSRDAKTPVRLARCVVMLIDVKSNMFTNAQTSILSEEARNEQRKKQFLKDIGSLFLPVSKNSESPSATVSQYKYEGLQPIKDYYDEKLRVKRDASPRFKNLANLDKLHEYTKLLQKCKNYMERVNNENTEFIRKKRSSVRYEMTDDPTTRQPFDDFVDILSKISKTNIALLSPRILSFWPSKKKPNLMSPSLLSFDDDGVLSIPEILRTLQANDYQKHELLELLLEVSGAGPKLTNVVSNILPQLEHMKEKIYPAILQMEQLERRFSYVKETLNADQAEQLQSTGYAFLQPDQMKLIYESSMFKGVDNIVDNYSDLPVAEREVKLENDIRQLALLETSINENDRSKRQVPSPTKSNELWPALNLLRPWAFLNRINEGVLLEAIILSPHAFFTEIAVPELLNTDILSPRAFQPAILSPAALLSRVLSPLAFGLEVLSPRALVAYVLSPEAFTADILSPQFLETHILSPEAFAVQILSPNIMGPRIASPEANSILVLSPNILSPRILSGERMLIEILSPHVLGGEETEEEEESNLHNENELPEAHKYHKHSQGRFFRPNALGQPETIEHADHPGHALGLFPTKKGQSGTNCPFCVAPILSVMISPSENITFAIPLVEPTVCCDSDGNYVPHVMRDEFDRIVRAAGKIKGGVLPDGSELTALLSETLTKDKVCVQQIIPKVWGGSGAHCDNIMYPTIKQHTTKAKSPTELELEIAERLKFEGNSVIFFYNFKYDGDSLFPSKCKRYIDVIEATGFRDCYRNGVKYQMLDENLSSKCSITVE